MLGLDAVRIGAAFLIPPKTMGQRMVRAKIKIRDGGIRFEIPDQKELPERLEPSIICAAESLLIQRPLTEFPGVRVYKTLFLRQLLDSNSSQAPRAKPLKIPCANWGSLN